MTSMSCIFLLNLEILLGTFFECLCIFIRFIRFTHCSTNHLRVTRTVLHQRLNIRVIHDAVGKIIMQTVSQMENFTGIFFHVMNDAVSLGYGLSALSIAVPSPSGSPPELLSFNQRRKGDLNSSEFLSLCFLWCGWQALCASVGTPRATAISMLPAEQAGLLSPSPRKGLGADVGKALFTNPALSCRVSKS